jgi:hypothetical protein
MKYEHGLEGSTSPRPSPPGEGEATAALPKIQPQDRPNALTQTQSHRHLFLLPGGEGQDEGEPRRILSGKHHWQGNDGQRNKEFLLPIPLTIIPLTILPGMRFIKIASVLLSFALFWLLSAELCFGQTDTNLIAAGDWSEAISDNARYVLRGRLLVYDESTKSSSGHARVYLELQHIYPGAWMPSVEVYYDIGQSDDLHFEMHDERDQPIPKQLFPIRGMMPSPCWVTLPCDTTTRLRADTYTLSTTPKPNGFEIMVYHSGCWLIPPNATNDFFLSATFTPSKDHPSPLKYHVWQGTLKLPKVKIPVQKP